ncbi:MAG: DNA alkylation repair protein [Candidatus Nomurabacteria bacterium]|nr:DNA alkylation repair protein [Candidatus Nomurabacteria bacterium]
MHDKILKEILSFKNIEKDAILSRFFKTGPGQYGEGDMFLGITVPISRKIAHKYGDIKLIEVEKLIKNKYHEVRLIAILILVYKYKQSKNDSEKKIIVNFYLKNTRYINNWDLVDLSAHYILGDYLINKDKKILEKLSKSKNIWERRISIISTFAFIYNSENKWTFKIVNVLMSDEHDLIQKACGWMLRESGKRVSEKELMSYLDTNYNKMPRTMLRYAIERLPENKRLYYLKLK